MCQFSGGRKNVIFMHQQDLDAVSTWNNIYLPSFYVQITFGIWTGNPKYEDKLVETEDDYLKGRTGTYQFVSFYLLSRLQYVAFACALGQGSLSSKL